VPSPERSKIIGEFIVCLAVLLVTIDRTANAMTLRQREDEQAVSSFKSYVTDFVASYKADRREAISKLGGGWVKEYYQPVGEPSIDVQRVNSLVTPYVGICEFMLRRYRTAFHKTRDEAVRDGHFVESDDTEHRHRYAYQEGKWVPKSRQHLSTVTGKWSDCNEVITLGENEGAENIFGCWEKN
jgi:hypothetical protein